MNSEPTYITIPEKTLDVVLEALRIGYEHSRDLHRESERESGETRMMWLAGRGIAEDCRKIEAAIALVDNGGWPSEEERQAFERRDMGFPDDIPLEEHTLMNEAARESAERFIEETVIDYTK